MGKPCPRCGGTDRFYYVANPRNGGAPFWTCNHCRHTESDSRNTVERIVRKLSPDETQQAHYGYTKVAIWCHSYLMNEKDAQPVLGYLTLERGFTLDTLREQKIGYHPAVARGGVGTALWADDRTAYEGARLGGVLGPQARPKSILRGTITIPYWRKGLCTLIRGRRFESSDGAKYLSPAGVELYAGGEPQLYLAQTMDTMNRANESATVLLTEGEFKALLAHQSNIYAVAQPGVGYLPDSFIESLQEQTIVVCYDSERRKDPFLLTPGERFSILNVEKLTGIWHERQIRRLQEQRKEDPMEAMQLQLRIESLTQQLELLRSYGIKVKVLRIPRQPDEDKVDIDSYILRYGADALKEMIAKAQDAKRWHEQHSGGEYSYDRGGMWNSNQIANYQARILETVHKNDGNEIETVQRLAVRTPSGKLQQADIPWSEWADDRAARRAVRMAVREGTFDDNQREILRAIRLLSNQGDPPAERDVYMATGWEQIAGKWHLLVKDGAINASGITSTLRAEIDEAAVGNWYSMCGPGDAATGAKIWKDLFLFGKACPQPLALVLAGQATLPLIHRFSGNAARSMAWIFNETGSLKTALIRAACLSLYGPGFTAEYADGQPISKWDATSIGLSYVGYYYRDLLVVIDDYKNGVIHPNQFKTFLHNYSEGSGRSRGKGRTLDRIYPARAIIISTAEDIPQGDPGMMARLLPMQLKQGMVDEETLTILQQTGAAGHFAAFWRDLVQEIAKILDKNGPKGLETMLTNLVKQDETRLKGHRRTIGSLRQNRMAFLFLVSWMHHAGWLSEQEIEELSNAHLDARAMLADVLEERQYESRASTVFVAVLGELIGNGDLVIEEPEMECPKCCQPLRSSPDGWYCDGDTIGNKQQCNYHIPTNRIVGFVCDEGVAILPQMAMTHVSRIRNEQRQPLQYSASAIWSQLDTDGHITAKGKKGHLIVQRRNPQRSHEGKGNKVQRVIVLNPSSLGLEHVKVVQKSHDTHDTLVFDEQQDEKWCHGVSESTHDTHDTPPENGAGCHGCHGGVMPRHDTLAPDEQASKGGVSWVSCHFEVSPHVFSGEGKKYHPETSTVVPTERTKVHTINSVYGYNHKKLTVKEKS